MRKLYYYSNMDVLKEAQSLINTPGASTYTVAREFDRPQSTIWWHMVHRLPQLDQGLFNRVQKILEYNNKRGGR